MTKQHSLNGQWDIAYNSGQRGRLEDAKMAGIQNQRFIEATVPGCVHQDLIRAGLIEEPTIGLNTLTCRWVEEYMWCYRKVFNTNPEILSSRAWLVFRSLDHDATISLNGEEIGWHQNSFYPCRIEVSGKLKEGENILTVEIESGLLSKGDKPVLGLGLGEENKAKHSHKMPWLRKPFSEFESDWSPRLINVGIQGDVFLEYTKEHIRLDTIVPLVQVDKELKTAKITLRAHLENLCTTEEAITLRAKIEELGVEVNQVATVQPGTQTVVLEAEVHSFDLWWPIGLGNQKLYTLETSLICKKSVLMYPEKRIGFRHVRMNQEPHPKSGNYNILEVNHRKVFLKGGNWVPTDILVSRIDDARQEVFIDRAIEANFNFLRIWGGGLYESDHFYKRCDELGILVWQEFSYACQQYPHTDKAFHEDALHEARYQVRRLAEHPSLVVWCGNNEMQWFNWEWKTSRALVLPDFGFFNFSLPRLLREEDPTRYYQPSSPMSPDTAENPGLDDRGDQHNWGVGLAGSDYRKWREMACRMILETGFLGPNALPTMRVCWPEGQTPKIGDFAWQHHDNGVDSWDADWQKPTELPENLNHLRGLPDRSFAEHLGCDIASLTLEEYAYLGGVLHGEALGTFADNFRRRAFDSSSACFWMFHDCWPMTRNWTIIDYYFRRTPGFWAIKRSFKPIHVALAYDEEKKCIQIFGINDTSEDFTGYLKAGICHFVGSYDDKLKQPVELLANASTLIASFETQEHPEEMMDSMPYAFLKDGDNSKIMAKNRYLGPRLCEIKLEPTTLSIELKNGEAIFTSPVFELGVCIDLDGEEALDDNFFDLYPNQPYRIKWTNTEPPQITRSFNPKN